MIIKAQAGNCIINFDRVNYIRVYGNEITAIMGDGVYADIGEYWNEEGALNALNKLATDIAAGTDIVIAPEYIVFFAIESKNSNGKYEYCTVSGATTEEEAITAFRGYCSDPIVRIAAAVTAKESDNVSNKWRSERGDECA